MISDEKRIIEEIKIYIYIYMFQENMGKISAQNTLFLGTVPLPILNKI